MDDFHLSVKQNVSRSDPLTVQVVEVIIPWMLDHRVGGRLSTQQVVFQSDTLVADARNVLEVARDLDAKRRSQRSSTSTYSNPATTYDRPRSSAPSLGESSGHRIGQRPPTFQHNTQPAPMHLQRPMSNASDDPFLQRPVSMPKSISEELGPWGQVETGLNSMTTQVSIPDTSSLTFPKRDTTLHGDHRYVASPSELSPNFARQHSSENDIWPTPPRSQSRHPGEGMGPSLNLEPQFSSNHTHDGYQQQSENRTKGTSSTNGAKTSKRIPYLSVETAFRWREDKRWDKKWGKKKRLADDWQLENLNRRDHVGS